MPTTPNTVKVLYLDGEIATPDWDAPKVAGRLSFVLSDAVAKIANEIPAGVMVAISVTIDEQSQRCESCNCTGGPFDSVGICEACMMF